MTNPNPNGYTQLNAVTVQGGTQVWAVGTTEASNGATIPLILKWNGTSWTRVTGAIPSGATNTSLWAVSALPSGELWAVGSWYDYAARRQRPLTEHYVGGSWRVVSTPTPGNYLANMLTGVAALASNNVWAVGFYDANGGTRETLAMHWDGAQWKVVASPNVSHTYGSRHELHGIVALGPSDIWAVGDYFSDATNSNKQTLTLHWNGTAWSIVASPNRGKASSLNAVAASGGVVSAVGLYSIYGSDRYTGQFQVPQNLAMRHF